MHHHHRLGILVFFFFSLVLLASCRGGFFPFPALASLLRLMVGLVPLVATLTDYDGRLLSWV